jgi:hypothetical protein
MHYRTATIVAALLFVTLVARVFGAEASGA